MITDAMVEAACAEQARCYGVTWPGEASEDALALIRASMRAAIEAAERAAWQDISTAPNEGDQILVIGGYFERAMVVEAEGEWWRSEKGKLVSPTHWRPLPAMPLNDAPSSRG